MEDGRMKKLSKSKVNYRKHERTMMNQTARRVGKKETEWKDLEFDMVCPLRNPKKAKNFLQIKRQRRSLKGT